MRPESKEQSKDIGEEEANGSKPDVRAHCFDVESIMDGGGL